MPRHTQTAFSITTVYGENDGISGETDGNGDFIGGDGQVDGVIEKCSKGAGRKVDDATGRTDQDFGGSGVDDVFQEIIEKRIPKEQSVGCAV